MKVPPKYRIVEVKQYGRTWYEVHVAKRESDYRESWETWTRVDRDVEHPTIESARRFRDTLIQSVRVERVVE